jgi:hypothetical protein
MSALGQKRTSVERRRHRKTKPKLAGPIGKTAYDRTRPPYGEIETQWVLPRARVVPRPLTELAPETAKLIEDVAIDNKGRAIPKLYSKLQANKELRAMLNLSAKQSAPDVTQLSDAELIETLARQAKELGVEIDLSYSFAQPKKPEEEE